MCGVDQRLEVFRAAVACVRRIREGAVVAPVPSAGKGADRHDLNCGHPKIREMIQARGRRLESPLWRERAEMQLVENESSQRRPAQSLSPLKGGRIDCLAGPVYALGLEARCRVGNSAPPDSEN